MVKKTFSFLILLSFSINIVPSINNMNKAIDGMNKAVDIKFINSTKSDFTILIITTYEREMLGTKLVIVKDRNTTAPKKEVNIKKEIMDKKITRGEWFTYTVIIKKDSDFTITEFHPLDHNNDMIFYFNKNKTELLPKTIVNAMESTKTKIAINIQSNLLNNITFSVKEKK